MSKESREYSVLSCHFKSLTPVSFVCQCWWRDPVSRLGPNRREACSASQRSHFSSIHPNEPNQCYVTVIFIVSFNYSSSSYLFSQVIRRQPTGLQSQPCLRQEPAPFLSFCHGLYFHVWLHLIFAQLHQSPLLYFLGKHRCMSSLHSMFVAFIFLVVLFKGSLVQNQD